MNKEVLETYISEGKSTHDISKITNKGHSTIIYWFKKYNLKSNYEPFKKKERFGTKRICKKHGLSEYTEKGRCKKCSTEAVQKRRLKLKNKAVEYKGGKCEKCGYNKYIGALDFHHIDPLNKDFSIGNKGNTRSWENIKKEIDKCQLLCANCHRETHAGIA